MLKRLLLFPAALTASAAAQCRLATDVSYINSPDWGCSSFDWSFEYTYTNEAGQTYGPYFAAYRTVWGQCRGNYTDCNGVFQGPNGAIQGTKYFMYNVWPADTITVQWQVIEPVRRLIPCDLGFYEYFDTNSYIEGYNWSLCN